MKERSSSQWTVYQVIPLIFQVVPCRKHLCWCSLINSLEQILLHCSSILRRINFVFAENWGYTAPDEKSSIDMGTKFLIPNWNYEDKFFGRGRGLKCIFFSMNSSCYYRWLCLSEISSFYASARVINWA